MDERGRSRNSGSRNRERAVVNESKSSKMPRRTFMTLKEKEFLMWRTLNTMDDLFGPQSPKKKPLPQQKPMPMKDRTLRSVDKPPPLPSISQQNSSPKCTTRYRNPVPDYINQQSPSTKRKPPTSRYKEPTSSGNMYQPFSLRTVYNNPAIGYMNQRPSSPENNSLKAKYRHPVKSFMDRYQQCPFTTVDEPSPLPSISQQNSLSLPLTSEPNNPVQDSIPLKDEHRHPIKSFIDRYQQLSITDEPRQPAVDFASQQNSLSLTLTSEPNNPVQDFIPLKDDERVLNS